MEINKIDPVVSAPSSEQLGKSKRLKLIVIYGSLLLNVSLIAFVLTRMFVESSVAPQNYEQSGEVYAQSSELLYTASNSDKAESHSFKNTEVLNLRDKAFYKSDLAQKLKRFPWFKVYLKVNFPQNIRFEDIDRMRQFGWLTIAQKPISEYTRSDVGIFSGSYNKIGYLVKSKEIESVELLVRYEASGSYILTFTPQEAMRDREVRFQLPLSSPGKTLVEREISTGGHPDIHTQVQGQNFLASRFSMPAKSDFHLLSRLKYQVDLNVVLDHHLAIAGREMTLKDYHREIMDYSEEVRPFMQFSEKIELSEYIEALSEKVQDDWSIDDIWRYLDKQLDQDIQYDHRKRELFFSGQMTYNDIRDMYMSAAELGDTKIGACPERSSLEAAFLRRLGIASRTATRLYHIYVEVFLPGKGWVTTSETLSGIPLVYSENEDQSYFVDWEAPHPVNIKWQGYLYPSVLFGE